jgi:hypothetical protein
VNFTVQQAFTDVYDSFFINEEVVIYGVDYLYVGKPLNKIFDFIQYMSCALASPFLFVENTVVTESALIGATSTSLDVKSA